jgi:hypothetical protein
MVFDPLFVPRHSVPVPDLVAALETTVTLLLSPVPRRPYNDRINHLAIAAA